MISFFCTFASVARTTKRLEVVKGQRSALTFWLDMVNGEIQVRAAMDAPIGVSLKNTSSEVGMNDLLYLDAGAALDWVGWSAFSDFLGDHVQDSATASITPPADHAERCAVFSRHLFDVGNSLVFGCNGFGVV